jgi:hypothetical protein
MLNTRTRPSGCGTSSISTRNPRVWKSFWDISIGSRHAAVPTIRRGGRRAAQAGKPRRSAPAWGGPARAAQAGPQEAADTPRGAAKRSQQLGWRVLAQARFVTIALTRLPSALGGGAGKLGRESAPAAALTRGRDKPVLVDTNDSSSLASARAKRPFQTFQALGLGMLCLLGVGLGTAASARADKVLVAYPVGAEGGYRSNRNDPWRRRGRPRPYGHDTARAAGGFGGL